MNKSKQILIAMAGMLSSLLIFSACTSLNATVQRVVGNGKVKSEKRQVKSFDAINVLGSADVELRQGALSLELRGEENILPYILTEVEGSTLVVRMKKGSNLTCRKDLKVLLTVPNLKSIKVQGSGDVDLVSFKAPSLSILINGSGDIDLGNVRIDELKLQVNGSGDIEGRVQGAKLESVINGSGDIDLLLNNLQNARIASNGSGDVELKGNVENFNYSSSGSGDLDARSLTANDATIVMSGSGSGSMRVNNSLDIRLGGSSSFVCYGNPSVTKSIGRTSKFVVRP